VKFPVPVTATPQGFRFFCPFCAHVVLDHGDYAETVCRHEFEVMVQGTARIAVFRDRIPVRAAA
jgi:hypothetical protein